MPLIYTIQCAPRVDHIDDKGQEYTQLPYPYHVDAEGNVHQQHLWEGKITKLIGFQRSITEQRVDLFWHSIDGTEFPDRNKKFSTHTIEDAKGMYPVFCDEVGAVFSFSTPVDTIVPREFTDEQLEILNG